MFILRKGVRFKAVSRLEREEESYWQSMVKGKRIELRISCIKSLRPFVEFAKVRGCGIISEGLKGIRKRFNFNNILDRRLHSWSFRKLQHYIEYKAKLEGLPVVFVNPKNTSSRCPICGGRLTPNEQWREKVCKKCEIVWNRDIVGCLNLLKMWRVCVTTECLGMNLTQELIFRDRKRKYT